MLIKKTVIFANGKSESGEINELDFPQYFSFPDVAGKMKEQNANMIIVNYNEDIVVTFNRKVEK